MVWRANAHRKRRTQSDDRRPWPVAEHTGESAGGGIPGLHDFARPLLTQALTSAGYSVPIDQVSVRLYTPSLDAFGVATGGFSARTLSWLQAALHNFEEPETQERYFAAGSGFITSPDAQVIDFGIERRILMETLTDEGIGGEVSTPDEDEPVNRRPDHTLTCAWP